MKVTLTHDGKSVELDLTAEQMNALGLKEEKKKTGYERVGEAEKYYPLAHDGSVLTFRHVPYVAAHENNYSAANYHSDYELARANARADKLMRQLRRFAAENGGIPSVEDWNGSSMKYTIACLYENVPHLESYGTCSSRTFGAIFFNDKKAADKAIKNFHDELIWYFTEYKAMLR